MEETTKKKKKSNTTKPNRIAVTAYDTPLWLRITDWLNRAECFYNTNNIPRWELKEWEKEVMKFSGKVTK